MEILTEDEIKNKIKKLSKQLKIFYNSNIKITINFKGNEPLINVTIFDV